MTRLSIMGRATFLTLSSSFALFPFVFSNPASASSSNSSSETTEHKTVLVTASRLNEDSASSSANVTIITSDEIRDSAASNLVDLLGTKAGVNTRSLYGGAKYSEVGLRGFGPTDAQNTLILIDGRRLNDLDLSGANLSAIPLENIERIEILRGAGSVLYGDGAVGGAINIITKAPQPGVNKGRASVEYGSYQHKAIRASGMTSSERTAAYGFIERNLSEGYRTNNASEQVTGALDVSHYLDRAELYFKASADDHDIGLPAHRTSSASEGVNDLGDDPRGAATPNSHGDNISRRFVVGSAIDVGNNNQFIVDVGNRQKDQDGHYDYGAGYYEDTDAELKELSFTPRFKRTLDNGGEIIAGIDRFDSEYSSSITALSGPGPYASFDLDVESASYYFNVRNPLSESVEAVYGARMQTVEYFVLDNLYGGEQEDTFNNPAYTLGLNFNPDQVNTLSLHYNRAVRFNTIDEMDVWTGSVDILKPQTSDGFDLGWLSDWDSFTTRSTVYFMNLKNEIGLYIPDGSMFGSNINLDPTRRRGVEFELSARVLKNLDLDVGYGYQKATFRDGNNSGKRMTLVPEHKASLGLRTKVLDVIRLASLLSYTGPFYKENDQANAFNKAPSYTTLDFKMQTEVERVEIELQLNNVLDKRGYSFAVASTSVSNRFNAYPLPERNALLRLSYDF